jgi:hypothetical protein
MTDTYQVSTLVWRWSAPATASAEYLGVTLAPGPRRRRSTADVPNGAGRTAKVMLMSENMVVARRLASLRGSTKPGPIIFRKRV